jgi:hypothetical protein
MTSEYNYLVGNVYFSDKKTRYGIEILYLSMINTIRDYIKDNIVPNEYSVRILYTNKLRAEWDSMVIYLKYKPSPKKIPQNFIDEICEKFIPINPDLDFMKKRQFYVKFEVPQFE